MLSYSAREVQRRLANLLEEIPFQITRYGKVIAVVNKPNGMTHTQVVKSPIKANVTTDSARVAKCEYPGCVYYGEVKHGFYKKATSFGGFMNLEAWLCPKHDKLA